jgi:hypothetical protein
MVVKAQDLPLLPLHILGSRPPYMVNKDRVRGLAGWYYRNIRVTK